MTEAGVEAHNTLMCFGYVLGRALVHGSTLSVLDWGGGLGQYSVIASALYPEAHLDYCCVDLPVFATSPDLLVPLGQFQDAAEPLGERTHDLVVASGALQYVEAWQKRLTSLASATRRFVFITRLPVVMTVRTYVTIQRPYAYGYDTEYAGWVLNRREFLNEAETNGLKLRREFLIGEEPVIPKAPEQPSYRGFLFERRAA
jgi:putative methyltransferase (TIGR04325 family)